MYVQIGSLNVVFHRTVRVAEGREASNLPPSLGRFETYKVKDYKDKCPESWEEGGIFIPIQQKEAMWMSFSASDPIAILVGAGNVNAVTGKKLTTKLEEGNYIVVPPQPWLDGWKNEHGTVCQFVAAEYKGGEGLTVGEQILGEESKTGGIGFVLYEPKDRTSLKKILTPPETSGWGAYEPTNEFTLGAPKSFSSPVRNAGQSIPEMGLGKGGEIHQKIYEDPYGLEVWKEEPSSSMAVYLIGAEAFAEITGKELPTVVTSEGYQGKWFGLKDQETKDTKGSQVFVGLKSAISSSDEEEPTQTEKEIVATEK